MLKTHASHSQPINIINNFIFMLSVSFFLLFWGRRCRDAPCSMWDLL